MSGRPRLLDLFCGAGGASVGYYRAGFDVVGVDIAPQPNYPFEFYQADALALEQDAIRGCWHEGVRTTLTGRLDTCLGKFAVVHASPPCQGYTALAAVHGNAWPKLVEPVRELLDATGLPYVIENVQGSPVRRDMTLCGEMFGLGVIRHRYFELGGWQGAAPAHKPHRGRVAGMRHGAWFPGPYFAVYGEGGGKGTVVQWQAAMDIAWTDVRHEIAEAVPPAYTEFIGRQLLDHLRMTKAVAS